MEQPTQSERRLLAAIILSGMVGRVAPGHDYTLPQQALLQADELIAESDKPVIERATYGQFARSRQ